MGMWSRQLANVNWTYETYSEERLISPIGPIRSPAARAILLSVRQLLIGFPCLAPTDPWAGRYY